MATFYDAQCSKCKKKYGWEGHDVPPCPHCGNPPNLEATEIDKKQIELFREFLRERKKAKENK